MPECLGSSPVAVISPSDFAPASSKEFLDIQATVECGFTLKRVRDMTRTYSPIDFVFKDKAKFDVQNPIIGLLFEQITKNKKKEVVRKLLNASTAQKDTKSELEKIAEFSRKIRKDDGDVDDDDAINTAGSSSTPVADRSRFLPKSSLIDTKKFLLDLNVNENI